MPRSRLCDHSDAYIFVKGTITAALATAAAAPNNTNKKVIFKNCAPFTSCISRINNMQVNEAVSDNGEIVDFTANNAETNSFKIKETKSR